MVSRKNNVEKLLMLGSRDAKDVGVRYGSKIMRVVRKTPQDDLLRRPVSAEQKGSGPCIMAERLKSCRVARVDRIVVVKYRVPIFGAFGLCS